MLKQTAKKAKLETNDTEKENVVKKKKKSLKQTTKKVLVIHR